jgi:hypothetical protein
MGDDKHADHDGHDHGGEVQRRSEKKYCNQGEE